MRTIPAFPDQACAASNHVVASGAIGKPEEERSNKYAAENLQSICRRLSPDYLQKPVRVELRVQTLAPAGNNALRILVG